MNEPVYIEDQMAAIAAKVDTALFVDGVFPHVYFMHGHPIEIVNRLQAKVQNPDAKDKRFPLIILLHDFKINRNKDAATYGSTSVNLIIAALTKSSYNSDERKENVFKPVLYPILKELLNQIEISGYYSVGLNGVQYDQTDRYFWGKNGLYGNTGNIFNDFLDAIDIENLKLVIENKQDCKPLSNF